MLEALLASAGTLHAAGSSLLGQHLGLNYDSRQLSLLAFSTAAGQLAAGARLGERKQLSLALGLILIISL